MATKEYYFNGIAEWAKVQPHQRDKKYDRYAINVVMDEETMKRFRASGAQIMIRQNNDEDKTEYGQFHRPHSNLIKGEVVTFGPPQVFLAGDEPEDDDDQDYKRFDGEIGNGSEITVKIVVYDTVKGPGHRLQAIRINNLVVYDPPKKDVDAEGIDNPW